MLRFRSALYREAGVQALARMVLGYLWDFIYRAGITKQQVLDWFLQFLHCDVDQPRQADVIPADLVNAIARIMAGAEWNCGDFAVALEEALDQPIAGYRWKAGKFGQHILVKVRSDVGEHAIVRGKRFADSIFIGAWWSTQEPKGSANQSLQRLIRKQGGATFWNEPRKQDGGRQYGAFVVVDRDNGEGVANQLCSAADAADLEGGGEHRLSAISMVGIAEHRDVRNSDQVWVGCIRSIKFNWEYSLPDLLNGRIEKFKRAKPYKKLIEQLRER